MRRRALFLAPLVLLAAALATQLLARHAWRSFTGYQPPFAPAPAAAAPPDGRLVEQVVVVLVDGLGQEASRGLPFLDELRQRGADLESRASTPSFSLPGRAALWTGATAEVHGQTTNFLPRPLRVDHLFWAARRAGLPAALASYRGAHQLVALRVPQTVVYPSEWGLEGQPLERYERDLEAMLGRARQLLSSRPALAQVDLVIVDEATHGWGVASPEAARARSLADAALRGLAAGLDPARAVLAVVSDHGHVARGGHGGPEEEALRVPLVLAGGPVRAGTKGTARQIDFAPTVAALLGIAPPAASEGRPLLEALDLAPEARQAILARTRAQRQAFVDAYASALGAAAPGPAGPDDERALAELDRRQAELRSARREAERAERSRHAWLAALLVVALGAGLAVATSGGGLGALACGLAGFGAFAALAPAFGLAPSFSAVNQDGRLSAFFRDDMALAVACCALAALAAGALGARRQPPGWRRLAAEAWLAGIGFAAALGLRMATAYVEAGLALAWVMPDVTAVFRLYLDALALVAVGFSSPALPLAAWLGARLAAGRPRPGGS